MGGIVAWFAWGCMTRKPKIIRNREYKIGERAPLGPSRNRSESHARELEIGPAYHYSPRSPTSEQQGHDDEEYNWKALDDNWGTADARQFSVDLDAKEIRADTEPGVTRSPRLPSAGFSLSTAFRRIPSQKKYLALSRGLTAKTARTGVSASVYSQVDEDDYEDEKLATGQENVSRYGDNALETSADLDHLSSRRRAGHQAQPSSSELRIEGLNIISRDPTAFSQLTIGHRMVDGSPLPTPAVTSPGPPSHTGFVWEAHKPTESHQQEDLYTRLPTRSRDHSREGVNRVRRGLGERRIVPLPQSPPQISTPQLEDQLCFSPKLR